MKNLKKILEDLKNNQIISLNLQDSNIGAEGAKQIADALKNNTSLSTLNLNFNGIGAEGAKQIADALKTNTSLSKLNLFNNYIGAEGAKQIADALKTNTSLSTLNLTDNGIGDELQEVIDLQISANELFREKNKHFPLFRREKQKQNFNLHFFFKTFPDNQNPRPELPESEKSLSKKLKK